LSHRHPAGKRVGCVLFFTGKGEEKELFGKGKDGQAAQQEQNANERKQEVGKWEYIQNHRQGLVGKLTKNGSTKP